MKSVVPLIVLAALAGLLLAGVNHLTGDKIIENREASTSRTQTLVREILERELKSATDQSSQVTCETETKVITQQIDGYGGPIEVVAGYIGSELKAVRIANHSETPGFADILEPESWLGQFGRQPTEDIDAVTRSTITSNAALRAVRLTQSVATTRLERCLDS